MARPLYAPRLTKGTSDSPLFLRIARQIIEDIRGGRLRPGEALPGSRELSRQLGVHRNTALSALSELEQQGWVETAPRKGTFVSQTIPEQRPTRTGRPPASGNLSFDLPVALPRQPFEPVPPGVLPLVGGTPDLRLVPAVELSRAYRRALRHAPRLLQYGSELGDVKLRAVLSKLLRDTRGLTASAEDLLITRGSQMAIFLAGLAVVRPGGVVAVEAVGYRPAWEALRLAGARLAPIPIDAHGISVSALERLTERERISALYTTPHHQYPTTVTLSAARRLELLALARRKRFVIIEDDYDHEHHYDGRPVLPLASVDPQVVAYVGTLSKVLAPGLRIGYLAAPPEVIERAARARTYVDRQGDLVVERAVAELIEEDLLGRHVRRVRREYQARRDALMHELTCQLGGALSFRAPSGGMALWAKVTAPKVSADGWAERALARKVWVQPARRFRFDAREAPYLRLGFAPLRPDELRVAVERLAAAL